MVNSGDPVGKDGGMRSAKTIVFVHAHPDDEALLTAGTMARAAADGQRVVLVTATDGAAGLAADHLRPDLGERRLAELHDAAARLGVARLEWLGYADSGLRGEHPEGFAHQDPTQIATRIAHILDEEQADVLIGYDPSGGYGHPDHLQVHRCTRLAAAAATHRPRLFEATLPREPITNAVHLATRLRLTPDSFDPTEFDRAWTPRASITHRVNVRRQLSAKRAALRAHASQATADGSLRTLAALTWLPTPVMGLLLGTEYYVEILDESSQALSTRPSVS
jgi:LmbE family N-acetylglucosaminyl deacetylase